VPPALFLLEAASQNVRASLRAVGSASEDTGRAPPYGEVVDTQHTGNPHVERLNLSCPRCSDWLRSKLRVPTSDRAANVAVELLRHLSTRRPVASATLTRVIERS